MAGCLSKIKDDYGTVSASESGDKKSSSVTDNLKTMVQRMLYSNYAKDGGKKKGFQKAFKQSREVKR